MAVPANFNIVKVNNTLQGGIMAPLYDRREDREQFGNDAQRHLTIQRIRRTAPKASWQTLAVRSLFTTLGTGDQVPYVALDGSNGVQLIAAEIASDGIGYASGSGHPSYQALAGILALNGLSWSKGRPVVAGVDAFFLGSDGVTDPVTASTASLPTLAVNTEVLGLFTTSDGTNDWEDLLDTAELSIDHRIENNVEPTCYHADQPHPVLNVGPGNNGPAVISLRMSTEDLETAIDPDGVWTFTFKAQANQGIGYGTNTASFTLRGLTRATTIPGADGTSARRIIECVGMYDGSNPSLTIATG